MADSSRRRRRMPHPTVVPAFVVLASTAAATTPAASGGPAAMAPPPRRPTAAFASSASGNRNSSPERSGGRERADDGDGVGLGFEGNTAGVMRRRGHPPGAAAAAGRRRRSLALLSSRLGSSSSSSSRLGFAVEVPRLAGGQIKTRWWTVGPSSSSEVQQRRGLFEWGVVARSASWRLGSSTTSRPGSNDTTPSSNPDTWRHRSERPPAVSSDADGSGAAATAAAAAAAAAYSALCPALHGWPFPEVVEPPPPQQPEGRERERERGRPPPAGRRRGAAEVETKAPRGTALTADATGVASAADPPGALAATAVLTVEGGGQEELSGRRVAAPGAATPRPPPSRAGAATGAFGGVRFDVAASAEGGSGGVTGGAGRVDPDEGRRATVSTGGGRGGGSGSGGGGGTGGGGSGGKRATRKRPRGGGVATFESAEDRALRQLLLEATKSGRGGVALRALRLMVEENLSVSQKQYVGAMEACMRQGSWTSGLEVFRLLLEDLRPRGLSPKQSTWRSLARGLRSVGQADQALVVLRQALRAGVGGIDEQVCSILLDLCAVKGRMGLAEEIASLMETHRIPKGPVTYCVLLKGYGRQRRLGGVESTMREMKERGIVPDVVALNAAVDAFVRCGELSKARTVLRSMEESPGGSIAQTLSYNTLIKGLGRELLVDEAFGVARGMVDKGCLPDEVTTNSLVDICVRSGNLDRAYNLLKNPTLFPPPPPPQPGRDAGSAATAAAAAEAGADAGGGVEGTSPGGAGKEAGLVRPSVEAFTSVLTGFAGVGDKDRALAVFQQMVTAGVEPNVVTYTGLISACVHAGDMDGARRLFSALEARGAETPAMQPSAFTYNTLIRGLCRMGNDAPAVRDTGAVGLEEEVDMDIGIFADEDLLPSPDGGSGGGEGRSAGMATRPGGYFYERGTSSSSSSSPPSKDPNSSMKDPTGKKADGSSKDPAAEDPTGEKIGSSFKDLNSSKDPAGKKTDVAPGPSARNDDETVSSFSSRGGGGDGDEASPGVESPPEILPASYAGSGSSSSSDSVNGGAIPEGIQEALRVLLSMRRRGVPADEVTMNSITDGLVSCSPPRVREAETLLKLMTGWGLKPNQVSFTVMLKGYGRIGDLGAAELMFEVMAADRDQRPDVVALNSILDACVRNGDLRRAVEILEQASASALSRRPIFVRHQDWLSSSSTRRPWGGGAGDGAVAICAAAAPGSGIGVGMTEERERVQQGGSAGVTGPGRGRGRDEGVVVDVWPNQISFATVVLGLSRRGDAPAGRKAIKLYESMRRDFKIVPDEGMVDNLIMACCNAQAGEMDGSDLALAQGQEALNDLRDLGWNEELIAFKEQMLMRVVPTLSEVWKGEDPKEQSEEARQAARLQQQQQQQQQRTGGKAGASRKRKVSAEIFEKYGWNKMESHFPIL